MKKLFTIVGILSLGVLGFGQACDTTDTPNFGSDENECKKNLSLYREPMIAKNYEEAAVYWWKVQAVCPLYKPTYYSNGTYIYSVLSRESLKAKDDKLEGRVDSLFMIYDLWMKNFGVCDKIEVDYATDIMSFKRNDFEKAYTKYEKSFKNLNENDVTATMVQFYFYSTYLMVKNGKADCEDLLNKYDDLSTICEKKIKTGDENDQTYFKQVLNFLDQNVAPCAGCDKLEELFKPKFEAAPENVELMEKIVTMMGNRKCTESDFYLNVVETLHVKKPTYTSAFGLGMRYYGDKNYTKAMKYFEEALSMTEDEDEKLKLYTYLANSALQKGASKEAVKWAEKIGGSEFYAIKAQAIARSAGDCGSTAVKRSFVYCLALDYAEKSGGKVSSSTMNAWKQRLSSTQDLFFEGYSVGQSVEVECWGETTKIRAKE